MSPVEVGAGERMMDQTLLDLLGCRGASGYPRRVAVSRGRKGAG